MKNILTKIMTKIMMTKMTMMRMTSVRTWNCMRESSASLAFWLIRL